MIKRAYLANGTLLRALNSVDMDVYLSSDIGAILLSILRAGDWCYLVISDTYSVEVIKVYLGASGLEVFRGQDGTLAGNFSKDTTVKYGLTSAEILDAVSPKNYTINADGSGVAIVQSIRDTYIVSIPVVNIQTVGGVDSVTTVGNEVELTDKNGAFGCCNSGVSGAPFIDGAIFYLTSQLYPYLGVDIITPQPKNALGENIPPIYSDLYILDQPFIYEYLNQSSFPTSFLLYGGEKNYTIPPDGLKPTAYPLDWLIYGGQKFYTPIADLMGHDTYLLELFLFGSEVFYTYDFDEMKPDITLTSLELI